MHPAGFKTQMKRLVGVWGQRHFNEERMTRIWQMVESISEDDFSKTVDTMLDNLRYAPLPKDFQEATRSFKRYGSAEEKEEVKHNCETCYDLGFLRWPNAPIEFLAVRCHCQPKDFLHHEFIKQVKPGSEATRFDFKVLTPKHNPEEELQYTYFNGRVAWWKSVLRESNEFWRQNKMPEKEEWWMK